MPGSGKSCISESYVTTSLENATERSRILNFSGGWNRFYSINLGIKTMLIDMETPELRSFFWGVATSGYQAEGGYNGEGEPLNNWAWAERKGSVAVSGRSSDFWNLAQEDFARCKAMGLNSFRLSLEWSRIQPTRELGSKMGIGLGGPPPFDQAALYCYAQRLAACREAGLEPIVTLHHFVQPAWLGLDAWQNPCTIEYFLDFVKHTLEYLLRVLPHDFNCEPPKWFITINEPNLMAFNHYLYKVFPSEEMGLSATVQCMAHLMEAHIRAYRLIHEIYAKAGAARPKVTFNNYAMDLYWGDTVLLDLMHASNRMVPRAQVHEDLRIRAKRFDKSFLKARLFPFRGPRFFLGQGIKRIHHWIGRKGFKMDCWNRVIALLYERTEVPLDYIAFDYYDPFIAHALRWPTWEDLEERPRTVKDWILESVSSKWWDWRMLPEGLAFFVQHLSQYGLPMMVAENGMAARRSANNNYFDRRDNLVRSHYLREHVRVVSRLAEQGQNLIGYLHWSLFDNYEWGSFTPRFGLFSLDYTLYPDRHAMDTSGDNPSATYTLEVKEANMRLERAWRRIQRTMEKSDASGPTSASGVEGVSRATQPMGTKRP